MKAAKERSESEGDFYNRATQLPQGDLEEYLVTASEFRNDLVSVATTLGLEGSIHSISDEELICFLRDNKTAYAAALANRLRVSTIPNLSAPEALSEVTKKAVEASNV